MLEGKCPKCGGFYCGWALLNPRHQVCPKCGTGLEITNGDTVIEGYSPFNGPTLDIRPASDRKGERQETEQ